MILNRIVEFAEKHASGIPTGYQPRFVTKVIRLDRHGALRAVIAPTNEQRGKRWGVERQEPQESPRRASGVKARLISDNVNYVLGKAREKDKPDQVSARHAAWLEQLKRAASELECPEVRAVWAWVELGGPESLREDPRIEEADDLTFEIDGVFPTDLASVRAYWSRQGGTEFTGQCLITGERGPVVDRMPSMVKGIPDGQMSGTALISVNNPAGESYGNVASLNSPVSPYAAEKLCNGLTLLINDGSRVVDDKGRERTKHKYALRVGRIVYLAWCRNEQADDFWGDLDEPDPEHIQQMISQPITGRAAPKVEEADFFALALSANAARIVVRDHHETTLATAKSNIARWYKRLSLVGFDGEPARPAGIYRLASSLYRDPSKEMPAHVPTDLIRAALTGGAFPTYMLGLAVKRNLAMQGPYALTKAKTKTLATSRIALIKAALTPQEEDNSLTKLDIENTNPAYHCGRMLAILESIQRIAVPGLNATLTDRHFGAACASPASVFGTLLKDAAVAHMPKLRKSRHGAFVALDRRLQEVALAIGPEFPKSLTLTDQGLFSLGYYHQKAHDSAEAQRNKELKGLDVAAEAQENNAE